MDINTKYNEGKAAFTKAWEELLASEAVKTYRVALEEWKATEAYKKIDDCGGCVVEDKLTIQDKEQLKKYKDAKYTLNDSAAMCDFHFKKQLIRYLLVSDGGITIPDFWYTGMKEIFEFDVNTKR